VGAWTSTSPPAAIAGHASSCAGVGVPNARSNQALVPGESVVSDSTSRA